MDIFAALAEPTRRRIVEILANQGQLQASAIYEQFDVSAPAISQHLKVLREARVVTVQKQAQKRLYRINPDQISELERWARDTVRLWSVRFDRLDELLQQPKGSD
jgi:DNA-binding transcriptional ArsR family regulator